MKTESGSVVWMTQNMQMSTNAGGSIGKAFGRMFSGEDLFNTVVTGPGRVWLQTMPMSGFAQTIAPFVNGGSK